MRKNKNLDIDYAIDDFMIYCQEKIRCIDTTNFSEFGDYTITQIIIKRAKFIIFLYNSSNCFKYLKNEVTLRLKIYS